ncbi:MAG TPA: DUF2064 domain-containing protein [Pseudolysinimonas sp.]|nr:DUF2064 domain-containing protein [Pseudolysinimonas sp.]
MTTLVIIAKECLPGRVKTRLHPDLSLEQAAEAAAASLADTFAALAGLPAEGRILAFDGIVAPAGSEPYDVIPQAPGDLDERLAAVFDAAEGPTILVGMDTPQLRAADLAPFFPWPEHAEDADFVFGPALDGGFWCLGMSKPRGDLIRGVPMSRDDTGAQQLGRLCAAGGGIRMLPPLIDVDTIVEARAVAALAPDTRFARTLSSMIGVAA